jgi:glycosyltransferase involved in cell wall biosynthesis
MCEALVGQGISVQVYTTTANGKTELEIVPGQWQALDGVSVVYEQRWTKDHSHFSPTLLWRLWRELQPDQVVHIHSWWNLVAMPAVLICWWKGIRPILSPRGMLGAYTLQSPLKRWVHYLGGKWLLRQTILHATAPQEAKEALQLIPNWEHFIAPNIIDLPEPGQFSREVGTEVLRLVFLSRIDPKKGIELLLEALQAVNFPWRLELYGTGTATYVDTLQSLAIELGIADRIEWKGWMSGEERYRALAKNDLFVLPSQNENFANVVLEALAVGTPVLVSDQVGLSDFVQQYKLGWVHCLTKEALAEAITIAYHGVEQRSRIEREAAALVQTHFNPTRLAQAYIAAYKKINMSKVFRNVEK